jgi:protoheme IX farnesyltransferase
MNLQHISPYLNLCKVRIAFFSALSAATGYLLVAFREPSGILLPLGGVFLLACGACALNQYQERDIDALMIRTHDRPIPSGKVRPRHALYLSFLLIGAGISFLAPGGGLPAMGLGIFALLWYNGLYTYLKRVTPFAAIPGALIGAIPPAIGWVSGGGALSDPHIMIVLFFFLIWQIPHFWLLLLNYSGDYERAGLPSLSRKFSSIQLKRVISIWISATAVACLLIPFSGAVYFSFTKVLLLSVSLWLVWNGTRLLWNIPTDTLYGRVFSTMNIFILAVMVFLSVDRLLIMG